MDSVSFGSTGDPKTWIWLIHTDWLRGDSFATHWLVSESFIYSSSCDGCTNRSGSSYFMKITNPHESQTNDSSDLEVRRVDPSESINEDSYINSCLSRRSPQKNVSAVNSLQLQFGHSFGPDFFSMNSELWSCFSVYLSRSGCICHVAYFIKWVGNPLPSSHSVGMQQNWLVGLTVAPMKLATSG